MPEPGEMIPSPIFTGTFQKPATQEERLALIESDLADARHHVSFLEGEWADEADLLAGIIDAQAALRKLMR